MRFRNSLPSLGLLVSVGVLWCALRPTVSSGSSALVTDHHSYLVGEAIVATFQGGPGNAKDWIGFIPADGNPPSSQNLSQWLYVDNTKNGKLGLTEGSITFDVGVDQPSELRAVFLLNDGYTVLADAFFRVVDPSLPFIRPEKTLYRPGEIIRVRFSSGPGNPTDWIGLYRQGTIPSGTPPSIDWRYVNGTQSATDPLTEGTVEFPNGLASADDYVVFFLARDGYTILSSELFSVALPPVTVPRVTATSPADGAEKMGPETDYAITIKEGTSKVLKSSVIVKLDGAPVTASFTRQADTVQIQYTVPQLFSPLTAHLYECTFSDDGTPSTHYSLSSSFRVGDWHNIQLPKPLYFQGFGGGKEGDLPLGWTSQSYTAVLNTDFDFGNLDSASYANWVVVDSDRFNHPLVTYSGVASTDYQRVLTPNPLNVINGKSLKTPLLEGPALFGDSGYRRGQSQVIYLYTRDFDLTGSSDVHLVFNSAWEQNQDSIGAVEYSIDQGQTWLPVVYLLEQSDIVTVTDDTTGESHIDVDATFNTTREDIAHYTDEGGNLLGGTYGAFVAAPISDELAPFIRGEVDDDPVGSKRVEVFRVHRADNQPKVRFRFAEAGTDSWYWGIDNVGLYSLTPAPTLRLAPTADQVTLSWGSEYPDFSLETTASLNPPDWKLLAGINGTRVTLASSEANAYFRLRRP